MKIYLDMVGCRLNQSEIEKIAFSLRAAGHQIVEDASSADLAVVNTCTVTASAAADSRKVIRRIARAGCEHIIATGCLASIDPDEVADLPAVDLSLSNLEKDDLTSFIPEAPSSMLESSLFREPLPGKHKRTRAFIKVQDGCDNHCTFCITRVARGKSRSVDQREIYRDIEYALHGGAKEVVLTGVNLGSWGRDLNNLGGLANLVSGIIKEFSPPRIRLSSIEPWDINEALLELLAHPSFCHHFHIPLQSGCDDTLKRMGRNILSNQFRKLIKRMRLLNPEIAITTDVIVGFPGETDLDFDASLDFVKEIGFSGGHVFRYSPRQGTPAAQYADPVAETGKRSRSQQMRAVLKNSAAQYVNSFINKTVEVLWEKSDLDAAGGRILSGFCANYFEVEASSATDLYNQISMVKIERAEKGIARGIILAE